MKKLLSLLFVVTLLLLAMIPAWGTMLSPSKAGANERLSPPPALHHRDGTFNWDVMTDTMHWLNDHFFLRQEMISANNQMNSVLFHKTDNPDVIVGKNGWLFYGSTLDDYTGINGLTDRELYAAAHNLQLMQEYCTAQGKHFAFTIAPNKNSLYGEFMPDFGKSGQESNAQRLAGSLKEMGVHYIDLFDAFRQQEEILYFAHDSHWNSKGAALGADTINAGLGKETDFFGNSFETTVPHTGDLYEMLYPAFDDTETDSVSSLSFSYEGKATKPDSITLKTKSDADGSLLCYRDSFGNLLHPYLASSFGSCLFSRSTSYNLMSDAEYVVIELVERNIPYLLRYTPVFPAPLRTSPDAAPSGTLRLNSTDKDCPEGYQLVTGTLPAEPDTDSPVCIVCTDGSYEATLGFDNQFSAYIPADSQVLGTAYQQDSVWIQQTAE